NTGAPTNARATCTARSTARAHGGRPPRDICAAGSCRTRSRVALRSLHALRQLHPLTAAALRNLDALADGPEDSAEIERIPAVALEVPANVVVVRTDDGLHLGFADAQLNGQL